MVHEYHYKKLTWLDLESPTKDEIRETMDRFKIHPVVAEELTLPSLRAKVDLYKNHIYLILHFPVLRHTHSHGREQEVDFIIGKDFLITTHYDSIDTLHKFAKIFEVNSILDKEDIGDHAGYLFFYLIRKLYRSLDHELEIIYDRLQEVEERIFTGEEKSMVYEISQISRDLLNFKQALRHHGEILTSLEAAGTDFFGKDFTSNLRAIHGEYARTSHALDAHRETLADLRLTNDSLLSSKTNNVMKILTIITFATFPSVLIANIFGMNAEGLPIIGRPFDFWVILLLMLLLTTATFSYFVYKKWL